MHDPTPVGFDPERDSGSWRKPQARPDPIGTTGQALKTFGLVLLVAALPTVGILFTNHELVSAERANMEKHTKSIIERTDHEKRLEHVESEITRIRGELDRLRTRPAGPR